MEVTNDVVAGTCGRDTGSASSRVAAMTPDGFPFSTLPHHSGRAVAELRYITSAYSGGRAQVYNSYTRTFFRTTASCPR